MITISESQVDDMRAARRSHFAKELADRARLRHPDAAATFPGEALTEQMTKEITAAQSLGLETRGELQRFADLAMVLGPGFEEREDWAHEVFAQPDMIPAERLRAAEECAVFISRGQ